MLERVSHRDCLPDRYALISPRVRPDPLPLLGSGVTKDRGVNSETDKRKRALMAVLVALDEAEHQVPNIEGLTLHSMAVVSAQCLLVLGRAEEGDIACFI